MYPDPNLELARLKIELHNDEKPFEIIHKHWGGALWRLIGLAAFLVGSIIAFIAIIIFGGLTQVSYIIITILGLGYLLTVIFGLSEWYSVSQRVLVITDQRIIDCQQLNFVNRHMQVLDIHAVKGAVGTKGKGWGTIFNFGPLTIEEIGTEKPVVIQNIPSPEVIAAQVLHYHNLVAHGGVESAHNNEATSLNEDKTPTLEELPKVAQKIAEDPSQKAPILPESDSTDPEIPTSSIPNIVKAAQETSGQPQPTQPTPPPANTASTPQDAKLDKQSLLLFHVPNDKLTDALTDLPSKKSPSLTPLDDHKFTEVRTIIPTDQAHQVAQDLKSKGAEDISRTELEPLA